MPKWLETPLAFNNQAMPAPHLGASQNLSFNASGGGSVTNLTPFDPTTSMLRVTLKTGAVRLATGASPVATATSPLMLSPATEFFYIVSGDSIAVISDDATTGTINIVECKSSPVPLNGG